MKMPRLILGAALFIFLTAPAQAMERIEDSFEWNDGNGFYFTCLDDTLYGTVYYTLRSHVVTTPSGVVHSLENYYGTGIVYSPATGGTWTQRFAIPIVGTVALHQGETFMVQDHEVYIPDRPRDPVFFLPTSYKVTVNANGDLVVEMVKPDEDTVWPDDYVRCVGKKANH